MKQLLVLISFKIVEYSVLALNPSHGNLPPFKLFMYMYCSFCRTPAWNYAPNPDKELLLQITGKMEPIQSHFTDLLMTKRLMTLQSVDDAVEKVLHMIYSK